MTLPKFHHSYDFVGVLGNYCAPASYMKRHFLRRASGPFDWNGESSAGIVRQAEIVGNDFVDFLKLDNLTLLEHPLGEHEDMKNDYYRDETTGIILFHDFPVGIPVEETYPEVRRMYDRRIARFYAMIAEARHVLLIYHTRHEHMMPDAIRKAVSVLRTKLGEKVDLLAIEHVQGLSDVETVELEDGVIHVRGCFDNVDVHWLLGDYRLLDRIYAAIPFRFKQLRRLQRVVNKWIACFHFSREARHEARERLMIKD